MTDIIRDIVGGMIVSADEQLLMGQKDPSSGRVYADGYWLIPGGGKEPGESDFDALCREILEETGLDISPYEHIPLPSITDRHAHRTLADGSRQNVLMRFLTYRVDVPLPAAEIPIQPTEELPVLRWVPLTQLGQYHLTPPSVETFTKLGLIDQHGT